MLNILFSVGSFLFSMNIGFSDDEELDEDEGESAVLPFGFVMTERADDQADPVFRDLEP